MTLPDLKNPVCTCGSDHFSTQAIETWNELQPALLQCRNAYQIAAVAHDHYTITREYRSTIRGGIETKARLRNTESVRSERRATSVSCESCYEQADAEEWEEFDGLKFQASLSKFIFIYTCKKCKTAYRYPGRQNEFPCGADAETPLTQ